ncbi:MAG: hypothetical protein Q7S04_02700 [Candidatus Moranbacteria bacterium]|nr:hypothetical protein [Candidatus Moranbacteria bacterium]
MPEFSPDRQDYEALIKAQKEAMATLGEAGAPARKTLKKQQKRTMENYIDTTREAALVENVLEKATRDEYRNLSMTESRKTFNQKGFVGKHFSGALGGHDVEIFTDGGYNRTLKIDKILIHSQRMIDGGARNVVKPSVDADIVDDFFGHFAHMQEELLKEKETYTGSKFIPKTTRKTFPDQMGL